MRKTLLIAAAALAASVISSQAQVYSQNIVGYVNKPVPTGFVSIANPLDASDSSGVNNAITNTLAVFSGAYDGAALYRRTGSGYAIYTIDSSWPTGVGNALDTAAVASPVFNPGTAFYLNNNTGVAQTNTFVGTVHIDAAATGVQVVGQSTNAVPTGQFFYASKLPIGGGLASVLQFPALSGNFDGANVYVPNIVGGAIAGYTTYTVDSGWSTGFGNALDTAQVAEPSISVGSGFLLNNNTGSAHNWVQAL